jgi:hypothetical protein
MIKLLSPPYSLVQGNEIKAYVVAHNDRGNSTAS